MSIHISLGVVESLLAHARRDYPNECCGLLTGRAIGPDVYVDRTVEGENISSGDRTSSYQIDWATLFATVRSVRLAGGGERLVGFYHSHPEGPAAPSPRDTRAAWVGYSYIIVSMSNGSCSAVTSWRMDGEHGSLLREQIVLA